MSPDLLDELRDADPARRPPETPEPDWGAMAGRIVAAPRARRRRRTALALAPALAAAAMVVVAVVALRPAEEAEVTAPATAGTPIYHYVVEFRELEGPDRRPVPDAHSRREGWVDPVTGEIHEVGPGDAEFASDGKRRRMRTDGAPPLPAGTEAREIEGGVEFPEPAGLEPPDGTLLQALSRFSRPGALRDEGETTLDGRRVRVYLAETESKDVRQTFFVDAQTEVPVLFRTETGEYLRSGGPIPRGQRVMEERFEAFERLPDGTDRSVLELGPE